MFICSIPDNDLFNTTIHCIVFLSNPGFMDTKYGAPIAAHIARRWVLYKQSKFACYVASLRALLHERKRLFI